MTPRNLLAAWSRLLLASLADAGVTDVVLSPGSRSTPLIVAAELEPRLRTHDSIDERAAAFFALGQARVTGRPSVVVCTSGTAVAHYLPAVVEANLAGVPLIVLSADRPLEVQDSAAAQTIDQIKLFGDQVRRFYELGAPDPAPTALAGLRRLAAEAVFWATGPEPGPVHLNTRARKPLEPVPAGTDEERRLEGTVDRLLARPMVRAFGPGPAPAGEAVAEVADLVRAVPRGLIVCGPARVGSWPAPARAALDRLAASAGYPVAAEATSQVRFAGPGEEGALDVSDGFDAVLRTPSGKDRLAPDLILQLGGAPTSSGYEQLTAIAAGQPGRHHAVVHPWAWVDPQSGATHVVLADPGGFATTLAGALGGFHRDGGPWLASWQRAREAAVAAAGAELDAASAGLTEAGVVRTTAAALPPGSLLMVGNSLPIRQVDTWCRSSGVAPGVGVLSQRGANGIDGLIAGAAGSASVAGRPVTLLVGDVSFVHDLTGAALAASVSGVPLVVVVTNNSGGRIFETLPIARSGLGPAVTDHVITPHGFVFEHAAALFGHGYAGVDSTAGLAKALDRAYATPGCTVVEAFVPADGGAAMFASMLERLDATLEETL